MFQLWAIVRHWEWRGGGDWVDIWIGVSPWRANSLPWFYVWSDWRRGHEVGAILRSLRCVPGCMYWRLKVICRMRSGDRVNLWFAKFLRICFLDVRELVGGRSLTCTRSRGWALRDIRIHFFYRHWERKGDGHDFTSEVIDDVGIRYGLYSGACSDACNEVSKLSGEWDRGAGSTCDLQDSCAFASWA